MMKKIIFFLLISNCMVSHAQFGNRGMQNRGQRQQVQTPRRANEPNFDVERYLGIVIYDIEKAAKKSSVKLTSKEGEQLSKILTSYNKEIKDIRRINSFTLRSTKESIENFQKNSMKTGDFSNQAKVQKKAMENLKPISEVLKEKDKELDIKIKKVLSGKQYKKWIKYNRKMNKFFKKEV